MKLIEKFSILCVVIYIRSNEFSECANDPSSAPQAQPKSKSNNEGVCTLPNESADTNYNIICPSTSQCSLNSNKVTSYTVLNINCQPGYVAGNDFQKRSLCLPDGTWSPAAVPCQRGCKRVTPPNAVITCTLNEQKVSCSKYLRIGTKITARCKPWFRENEPSGSKQITCEKNAEWSGTLSGCTPICGRPYTGSKKATVDGKNFVYGESPWHVAIYRKININFGGITLLSCIGTIITPYLILSDARCFFNEITQKNIADPHDFEAVVSKVTRSYDTIDNGQTKSYKIKNISYSEYNVSGNDTVDRKLALLEVEDEMILSPVVLPACPPSDKVYGTRSQFPDGTPLQYTDWIYHRTGQTYELELETTPLYGISPNACHSTLSKELTNQSPEWMNVFKRSDKFCVNNTKSNSNEGAGVMYQSKSDSLYYLIGVIEHNVKDLPKVSVTPVINVIHYMGWIKDVTKDVNSRRQEIIEMKESPEDEQKISEIPNVTEQRVTQAVTQALTDKPPTPSTINRASSTTCPLPDKNKYNFQYELICPDEYSETECENFNRNLVAPRYSSIKLACFSGYILDVNHEPESDCKRNSQWGPRLKPCKKICRKLKPRNVNLKCTYQSILVDCDGDLRSGTKVSAECLPEYRPEYALNYAEIQCDADGEWNAGLLRCVPNCGKPATEIVSGLIHGSGNATFGELPWHVAVYDKTRKFPNDLICGATILTEYIIISAAHCFHDRVKNVLRDPSNFEMVVGKITRDFTIVDSEVQKTYSVKKIFVKDFHGVLLRYQNDIAIIELETKIVFNPYVAPVCFLFSKNFLVPVNKPLKVAGWGIDENHEPSPVLKTTELPIMSVSECISKAPPDLISFFSSDKFCVGNVTGDSLDHGDSGGGLFYRDPFNSLYYLTGIVSFKSSSKSSFIGITNVNYYSDWISSIRNEIHDSRSQF